MPKHKVISEGLNSSPEISEKERELLEKRAEDIRREIKEIRTRLEKTENRVKGFKVNGNVRFS